MEGQLIRSAPEYRRTLGKIAILPTSVRRIVNIIRPTAGAVWLSG